MKIGGWKTRSVFERYAIVSRTDIVDAMRMLQQAEKAQEQAVVTIGHETVTLPSGPKCRRPQRYRTKLLMALVFCWCREGGSNPHDLAVGGF